MDGIEYVYIGKELGGRPRDPSCYRHLVIPSKNAEYLHEVNYTKVMKRPWFRQGIHRLLELAEPQTTAIMCSEENPALCHRHHLIARNLIDEYPEIITQHIRGDGRVINAKSIPYIVDSSNSEQLTF